MTLRLEIENGKNNALTDERMNARMNHLMRFFPENSEPNRNTIAARLARQSIQ